jgi:pimeloyl-ACP methyl ester carboxylesterase
MELVIPFTAEGSFTKRITGEGWWQRVDYHASISGVIVVAGDGPRGQQSLTLPLARKDLTNRLEGVAYDNIGGSTTTGEFDLRFIDHLGPGGTLTFNAQKGRLEEIDFGLPDEATEPFGPYRIVYHAEGQYSNCDLYCRPHGIWQFGPLFPVQAEVQLPIVKVNLQFAQSDIKICSDPLSSQKNYVVWQNLDTEEAFYSPVNEQGDGYLLLESPSRNNVYGAVWHETSFGSGADHYVHNFADQTDTVDVSVTDLKPDREQITIEYPLPLVMVHGWQSDYRCWEKAVPYLRDWSDEQGQRHQGYLCFACDSLETKSWSGTIEPNADRLAAYLADKVRPSLGRICVGGQTPPVNLVTHSMGGLIARACLSQYGEAGIANLVFLATPNGGSYTAEIGWMVGSDLAPLINAAFPQTTLPLMLLLGRLGNARDLTVRFAQQFNNCYPLPSIPCHFYAGVVNVNPLEPDPEDMIVHSASLVARNGPASIGPDARLLRSLAGLERVVRWHQAEGLLAIDMSRTMFGGQTPASPARQFANHNHLMMPTGMNVLNEVVHSLGDRWAESAAAIAVARPARLAAAAPVGEANHQLVLVESGLIQGGAVVSVNATLTADHDALFAVFSFGEPTQVVLTDPQGNVVDGNQPLDPSKVQYAVTPLFPASPGAENVWLTSWQLSQTTAGPWTVTVSRQAPPSTNGIPVLITASEPNPSPIVVRINAQVYEPGSQPHLLAVVESPNQPLSGLQMGGAVFAPDGGRYALELCDDGQHGDQQAGDLVFGAVFTNTHLPGKYLAKVQAQGARGAGEPFVAATLATFDVRSPAARIQDELTYRFDDSDGNGLWDALVIRAPITVAKPGRYELTGQLRDQSAVLIGDLLLASKQLDAGELSLEFRIPRAIIPRNIQTDGVVLLDLTLSKWEDGLAFHCDAASGIVLRLGPKLSIRPVQQPQNVCLISWSPPGPYVLERDSSPEFKTPVVFPLGEGTTEFSFTPSGSAGFFRLFWKTAKTTRTDGYAVRIGAR